MSRRLGTRLASLGALLLSFGAGPDAIRAASGASTGNDTLVVAYPTTPASLNPAVAYDGAGPSVLRGACEGLVRMRGSSTSAIEGVLATGWSHSKDFTVWTFALRHGVTFNDGTPFNASAVKFSIARTQIRRGQAAQPGGRHPVSRLQRPIDWLNPLYHSRDVQGDGSANAGLYHKAEVDPLLGQATVTLDAATRQRALNRAQQILTFDDPAAVAAIEIPNSTVNRSTLRGYYYNPVYTLTYDYMRSPKGKFPKQLEPSRHCIGGRSGTPAPIRHADRGADRARSGLAAPHRRTGPDGSAPGCARASAAPDARGTGAPSGMSLAGR